MVCCIWGKLLLMLLIFFLLRITILLCYQNYVTRVICCQYCYCLNCCHHESCCHGCNTFACTHTARQHKGSIALRNGALSAEVWVDLTVQRNTSKHRSFAGSAHALEVLDMSPVTHERCAASSYRSRQYT